MRTIRISDMTMKQKSASILTFKEKIELVKLLDKLDVDVIELPEIRRTKADSLCVKSIADTVKDSVVAVPVDNTEESIGTAWEALKRAARPRLQISAPVSLVQMEYLLHERPEKVKEDAAEAVRRAAALGAEVEFIAEDATRSERDFLYEILDAAIEAGASVVTVCDTAGTMLPYEFGEFIKDVRRNVAGLERAKLGCSCSDNIAMADACAMAALTVGADEVKAAVYPDGSVSLKNVAGVLALRGAEYGIATNVRTVELKRLTDQAMRLFTATRSKLSPFDSGVRDDEEGQFFSVHDDMNAIVRETERLGYDLSEEDREKVYAAFLQAAEKKEQVSSREIDAIVATNALQVPPTYVLKDFIINSGNTISATSHIRLLKNGELTESVVVGDGPVDASFMAIEQIAGTHYELDDFQIQAVTEGREAMGETVVKLRSGGKVYSGRGLSTDIIGSSISAYINALNKIVYEEENA